MKIKMGQIFAADSSPKLPLDSVVTGILQEQKEGAELAPRLADFINSDTVLYGFTYTAYS